MKVILLKIIFVIVLIPLIWIILNLLSYFIFKIIISKSQKNQPKAGIVVGYCRWYDSFMWMMIQVFLASVYYFCNHLKIELYLKGNKSNIEKILNDNTFESITLMGHGNQDYWRDYENNQVYVDDFSNSKIKQVIQMSCATKGYNNFTKLASNKDISHCKGGSTSPLLNIFVFIKLIFFKKFRLSKKTIKNMA